MSVNDNGNNGKMKVVIVDENEARRNQIKGYLPLYAEGFCETYGDAAKKQIRPGADGRVTDMVIMNADDSKGHGLYMFDWMKNEEAGLGLEKIPVLLLTADEFSERALDFFELGDAEFYEGAIDPDRLYSKMMETFDRAEFGPEPKEEPLLYTEEKSTDKVSGLSLKPVGEEGALKRSIVLSLEEQRQHLAMAIARGQKRNEQIKEMMQRALLEKAAKRKEIAMSVEPLKQEVYSAVPKNQQPVDRGLHGVPISPAYLYPEKQKKVIVVVEYDTRMIKTCDLFLRSQYEVVGVETGMRAIDYFVKSKADLLLINYHMPVLTGTKILESIRWQPNGKTVPAMFFIEGNSIEEKNLCKQEGVLGVISKPFSKSTLTNAVDSVFGILR